MVTYREIIEGPKYKAPEPETSGEKILEILEKLPGICRELAGFSANKSNKADCQIKEENRKTDKGSTVL